MARPLRVEFEGACYHVTARGNERRPIFRDDVDRRRFLDTLGECCSRFGLVVHGYCLMPNHYHLLASTPRGNLSRAVGWLQTTYAVRFNRRHGRCGHLVQGRFKAHLIDAESYARQVLRYVHLNPVRPRDRRRPVPAERRKFFESYLWSSHRVYAGTAARGEAPEWLSTEWLSFWADGAGQRRRAMRMYAADVWACFDRPLDCPWENLRGGLVLGDQALWDKARRLLSAQPEPDTVRWLKRDTQAGISRRVADLIGSEKDARLRIWARVRLAGESQSAIARELGYADSSGVHRAVARLEATAKIDPMLNRRMKGLKAELSNVKN